MRSSSSVGSVVAEAVGHLAQGRFLALVGPSGSGKSSLLRAGLMHALGSGALPGSGRWACSVIRPGDRPLDALAHALDEKREQSMLAVDQFEEVFTACSDVTERAAFLDALTVAAAAPDGATKIVIAMRADFYGRCAEHRGLASLLASHQILVGPMDADELRRAIELPAQRADLTVEEQLADSLVSDTVGQPGGLPLLSTALLELWTHRRDRTLHLDDYLRAGGVEGAVGAVGGGGLRPTRYRRASGGQAHPASLGGTRRRNGRGPTSRATLGVRPGPRSRRGARDGGLHRRPPHHRRRGDG